MVAEGLDKKPVDWISKQIASMGFNCVRLTWPLFMVTNDSLGSMSVAQSFRNLGLVDYIGGIRQNNPSLLDVSVLAAFRVRFVLCIFAIHHHRLTPVSELD